ncbi:MAG: transposase [Cetobacterium sp.]
MDDFALKKRYTYGTLLIDMETRKIVDLIESRELDVVVTWLKKFKNIKFFNRDGSYTYAKAISQTHPNAIQISDYFHLIKNLCDYLKEHLVRKLPRMIEIEGFFYEGKISIDESVIKSKYKYKIEGELSQLVKKIYEEGNKYSTIGKIFNLQYRTIKKYLTVSKEEFENKNKKISTVERVQRKQNLINKDRELYAKGVSKRGIARECNIAFKTINSYLDESASPKTKVSIVKNKDFFKFKIDIINLLNKNLKKQEIYKILREEKGYKYALRTFYLHVSTLIKENKSDCTTISEPFTIRVQLNKIISMLYKPINKINDFSLELYNKIIEKYPLINKILELINQFKELVQNRDLYKFDIWLKNAAKLNIRELNSFLGGIKRDKKAIENAITYRYTNALAEGSVNKLKTLKNNVWESIL